VTGGHSWGVAHVSDCPCTARRGISVTAAGRRGAYADVDLPLQRGAGVVVFEAMVWCAMRSTACVRTGVGDGRAELCACPRRRLSVDFVGNPAILSLRASDPSGTELAAATQLHSAAAAAGGVGGGLGSWHLYSLRLAVPGAFASLGLRVGSGLAGGEKWKTTAEFGVVMDEGAGSLNATDFWLGYEAAETLPTPSRDRDVVGPAGMGSRSPNLLTDGSTRTPPYGPVPWEIMAYGQSLQQHTVDLGAAVPVCGVRLHQTDVKWASHWSVQAWYAPDGSGAWSGGGAPPGSVPGSVPGSAAAGWRTVLQAVPQAEYDTDIAATATAAAVSGRVCDRATAQGGSSWPYGSGGCVRAVASEGVNQRLFPCTVARYLRLDLEQAVGCCYLLLEWQLLGLGLLNGESCDHQLPPGGGCLNGGRCAASGGRCICPAVHGGGGGGGGGGGSKPGGWSGARCAKPLCLPACVAGQGVCARAHHCRCEAGYHGEACAEERCGDGHASAGEECDDGNPRSRDGCDPACLLEDPRLDPSLNESLYVQYKRLYPDLPPPPPPPKGPAGFEELGGAHQTGGVLSWTLAMLSATHVLACCVCGSRDIRE
jgi:cysteine-rich repeat protein